MEELGMVTVTMTMGRMVSIGLRITAAALGLAVLAIMLDKLSYRRSYKRWKRGK